MPTRNPDPNPHPTPLLPSQVDHVEGYLREGFDAMDAFLGHTWAVTVTGAPKTWAIKFVEAQEASQRCWYGGGGAHRL